jgi:hypothetical protein
MSIKRVKELLGLRGHYRLSTDDMTFLAIKETKALPAAIALSEAVDKYGENHWALVKANEAFKKEINGQNSTTRRENATQ